MKLPILLLVLAALGHAATPQPAAKSSGANTLEAKGSGAKSSSSKQKDTNQTSKRELLEGNFGDRKGELYTYSTSEAPRIEYAQDIKDVLPDQSPAHQIFGARVPQIAKISDVLTGQGPSFEAALANHLYAPMSVYQARLSSPTTFEVPAPAASQVAYPNPKVYQQTKRTEDYLKLQEIPKAVELPRHNFNNVPVYTLKQPRMRFESYPQPLGPGFSHLQSPISQDSFRQPQPFSRQPAPPLFPVYNELGPLKYQGQILPSQYLQQQGLYQILPIAPNFEFVNQEDNHVLKGSSNQGSQEELKAESTERPQVQKQIPAPNQGYHPHPNGAISFASFSRSLPTNTQHEQTQPEQPYNQQQQQQLLPQQIPLAAQLQLQKQKILAMKQKLQYPSMFQKYVLQKFQPQSLPRYQSAYQPESQFITVQQPIRNQERALNPFQEHLLFQDPRHLIHPQTIQFQRLPAFKPLPQSQLTSESFYRPTSTPPAQYSLPHLKQLPQPRPFGYHDLSTQPIHIDQPLAPVPQQRTLTPLPPLKPNYNQYVQPLNPYTPASPVFLPTPLQPLETSTPKSEAIPDQLISSTTLQPDVKDHQEPREQSIHIEKEPESQTSQTLEPEITHQSQPSVIPLSVQSTTHQPFAAYEAQSEHFQYSTPQPQYQSTIRPQAIQTSSSPRHEVIIQQQELQELILDRFPQPSSTPHYQSQQQKTRHHQQELEALQLQSQQNQQLLEQLQPQQYKQELQELQSQQYHHQSQQLQSPQQHHTTQQAEPQQFQNQQHSESIQSQFQQQLETQQQSLSHEQHQSQQHQQLTEQKEPQQYQEQHLDSHNKIQLSTPNPSQEPKQETDQLQMQHQSESQPQTQYQSESKTAIEEPHEQPQQLPTSSERPDSGESFLDAILSPIQPGLPQLYHQPQDLLGQPDFGSPLGISTYPDVQYYGKYAESLLAGLQH